MGRPTDRSGGHLATMNRFPANVAALVPQQEFEISCATAPAGGLICGTDDGLASRKGASDFCFVDRGRRAGQDLTAGSRGEGQAPQGASRILKNPDSLACAVLIGSGVISRGNKRPIDGLNFPKGYPGRLSGAWRSSHAGERRCKNRNCADCGGAGKSRHS